MTLDGSVCVVTGASSGIGAELALALAGAGAHVWGIGRSIDRLESVASASTGNGGRVSPLVVDLEADDELSHAAEQILAGDRVDVLAHCAGAITRGPFESARVDDLDTQYRVNLRAPFLLTRSLLPALKRSRGQIVFVNSSVGAGLAAPDAALYAATKQGLKALADSLRQEVNPAGVRVLSVYVGRTATPMQERVHEHEGRPYRPELLMGAEDVVHVVLAVLSLGPRAEVTDVSIRPMKKSS